MTAEDFWEGVKEVYLKQSDIQKQGESLKIKRKMFAMFNKGRYVLKLPKERVQDLINSGEGQPYDPGNGKIMKEWVIIPEKYSQKWIELAEEAKAELEAFRMVQLKKVMTRYETLPLLRLATLLRFESLEELEDWLLDLPNDMPVKIDGPLLVIKK